MKHSRLLWLDDNPYYLALLNGFAKNVDLGKVLSRTTFCFDFEMGKRAVREQKFDCYILDGDFPDALPNERRAYLASYLRHATDSKPPELEGCQANVRTANFIRFYQEVLPGIEGKVVVFSGSREVGARALELGLPFYLKHIWTPNHIREQVKKYEPARPMPKNGDWECGGFQEFVDNILR
ncbi:MAG TPA: hypothetical protein VLJ21_00395 [Candidatus Binatia bacterium]|nr:hypothetical protein [Candidatus Binatia bacterium]